jgi:hypothetical protein
LNFVKLNNFRLNSLQGVQEPPDDENTGEAVAGGYLDVASLTIAAVRRLVLGRETFADLFEEMGAIRADLHMRSGGEVLNQVAARVEDVLARYKSRVGQAELERAADFRSVLDMLNEALSYLTVGSERADKARKNLETNLHLATRIEDVGALRRQLSKVLQSVREEGRQQREKAQEVIESLSAQIEQVHKAQSRFISYLPSRTDALEFLKQSWQNGPPVNLHAGIFVADSLQQVRERHSDEVANVILQDLGQKQIQPLLAESQVYEWSADALLLVWRHPDQVTSASRLLERSRLPFQQRAFVGGRVAVFSITLRSLVVQVRGSVEEVVSTLDRFYRRGGAC